MNVFEIEMVDLIELRDFARALAGHCDWTRSKDNQRGTVYQALIECAESIDETIESVDSDCDGLADLYLDAIYGLVKATRHEGDHRDEHMVLMSRYSALIAEKLGLPDRMIRNIFFAAPLHDIGKVGMPESVLLKPAKLTEEEFAATKNHTEIGSNLLADPKSDIIRTGQEIALTHHEKWDGRGYPRGLSGEDIPISGRIVAVADNFDALTTRRPHKPPYPMEVVLDMIKRERSKSFDPEIVDLFLENKKEILGIKEEVDSGPNWSLPRFA
jgi:putative two-component system response regulator